MSKAALILFRHGNTFEAGQTPVWVGAKSDLPLTEDGEKQAFAAATYVEQRFDPVVEIVSGPLKRHRRFAEVIAEQIHLPVSVDERLTEIDYGAWEGLAADNIKQRFGSELLEQWERYGGWPEGMGWAPSLEQIKSHLEDFLRDQSAKLLNLAQEIPNGAAYNVAVTSNGTLRLIYTLVTGKSCDANCKVKTGYACVLAPQGDGWRVQAWNEDPRKAKLPPVL